MASDRSSSTKGTAEARAHAERELLIEFLVAHATEGLPDPQRRMMCELCDRFPDLEATSFEAAAALFYRTFSEDRETEPLPESLSRKLHDQAAAWWAAPERHLP